MLKIAAAMAMEPNVSIPKQNGAWSQTLATYRFLHNERVRPSEIQSSSTARTRASCEGAAVALMIHDLTELDPVYAMSDTKLLRHTVLAVGAGSSRDIFGVMHQRWFDNPKKAKDETRRERRSRWARSQVWPEAVLAVGSPKGAANWIHVADREADDFQMLEACEQTGCGFVIRAQHDRYLQDGSHLRQTMNEQPVAGGFFVDAARRSKTGVEARIKQRREVQSARCARCAVSYAAVTLSPPRNDSRYEKPRGVNVVYVREIEPTDDVTHPIDWMLLTNEPVESLNDAMRIIEYYRHRWLIEEYHKAQKTGCRLEQTQIQDADAFIRLAAIAGIVAVRLLQLRQQADDQNIAQQPAMKHVEDPLLVKLVSRLAKHHEPDTLTVNQFYRTIAKLGGWLARKSDGRPGWQSLWHGLNRINHYLEGIRLMQDDTKPPESCV